jgi:amidase
LQSLETVSNLWGLTPNPANTLLSAGGSSGGEGAILACFGSPIGIGTDSGGSIRAPAAFNGLYALKPTSKRISYNGCQNNANGIVGVASAIGPMGRSLRDLDLMCQVLCDAEPWFEDSNIVEKPWTGMKMEKEQVSIGVMWWDGVVMPHPPIQRALKMVAEALRATGHEGA